MSILRCIAPSPTNQYVNAYVPILYQAVQMAESGAAIPVATHNPGAMGAGDVGNAGDVVGCFGGDCGCVAC
jgi:hypothetical protein